MSPRILPIMAFVGPHNSGKTGLVERLVEAASSRGYRVGVIKRAARPLQMDPSGKDSGRFVTAGAERVVALGPGRLMLTERCATGPALRSVCRRLGRGVDLWLAESYVPEPVPWVAVARDAGSAPDVDWHCVATVGFRIAHLPSFAVRHTRKILDFVLDTSGVGVCNG